MTALFALLQSDGETAAVEEEDEEAIVRQINEEYYEEDYDE